MANILLISHIQITYTNLYVGFANEYIASFWYSFVSYGEVDLEHEGIMRDTYRFFCITIDMKTGKKIELSDFMVVFNSRLLCINVFRC